jgi:hypothetical protein
LNGYSVIQAEDESAALDLLREHPFLGFGSEHAMEVFEAPKR